jgi:glycosyltransferase involved in cell wall biosynthesis
MNQGFPVLHTIASLKATKGGPSVSVSRLCEALSDNGIKVDLMTQKGWRTPESHLIPDLKRVQTRFVRSLPFLGERLSYAPFLRKRIGSESHRKHYKIIHDHGLWLPCNHAASSIANRLGIPFIVHPRGMLEPWALSYKAWKKRIAWRSYQRRDLSRASILVATSAQEEHAIRRAGLRLPIAIIPNGIDLPPETMAVNKSGTKMALFLSRIHPKKGLLNLVAAWAKTRPEGWTIVVAGPDEGGHRRDLESAIHRAGVGDQFVFAGPVAGEEKADLYRNADLFILPTFSENFGLVVAEALAYGVPVITTKGAPWEGLVAHGCGWWIDMNVEALASAIRKATNLSAETRQAMGERGRRYVQSAFAWSRIAHEMMSVYMWVLGQCERPACVQST